MSTFSTIRQVNRKTGRVTAFGLLCALTTLIPTIGRSQLVVTELLANRLVYDSVRDRIYASVPGIVPKFGNTIAALEPDSLARIDNLFVGSEPKAMSLSSSGNTLFVGLDGQPRLAQVDVGSWSVVRSFTLGTDPSFGPYYAEDVAAQPGSEEVVAVSRKRLGVSPKHGGVAVFDAGVMRPDTTPRHTGANVIEYSDSPGRAYGYCNESTAFRFYRLEIDSNGIRILDATEDLIDGFDVDIAYKAGRVYSTTGRVVNAELRTLAGTIQDNGLVVPDDQSQRVFFLRRSGNNVVLTAFNMNTLAIIRAIQLTNVPGTLSSFIRWGRSGFAFATSAGRIYSLQSSLAWNAINVPPDELVVVRGIVQSGGLPEVLTSDNLRLVVLPGIVFSSQQYPIVVEAKAEAPSGTEEAFSFTVETQGSSTNVLQEIVLYNYQTNSFDQLDVRSLTLTDTTISVDIFEGAQNYIEPVTKEVKARISFKAVGPVFVSPWQARADLIRWSFPQ